MRYISPIYKIVLHTQNVCVRRKENFLQAFEVKVFTKKPLKMIEYSEAWQSFRDLTFENPLKSHFSFNKKCLVGRMVMNQSVLYFPDLVECFTYPERMRTTHQKFYIEL